MAVSTNALSPAAPGFLLRPLRSLILAVAGMARRWRRQSHSTITLTRAEQARKRAEDKRAERARLPVESRQRSIAHFEALAAESEYLQIQAENVGDHTMAAEHAAEVRWFGQQARNIQAWGNQ